MSYSKTYYDKAKKIYQTATYKYLDKNPWVRTFYGIKSRCENSNQPNYKWYGARGIKCLLTIPEVKELWLRDDADALVKPSIDRIDSNGDYTKDNCQFIEWYENVVTRRHSTQ
jgi:hypothetical protein